MDEGVLLYTIPLFFSVTKQFLVNSHPMAEGEGKARVVTRTDEDGRTRTDEDGRTRTDGRGRTDERTNGRTDEDNGCWVVRDLDAL
jgi:hypothetical protein